MKKTIFILTAFIFCLQITALSQKASVGVSGGVAVANLSRTIGGADKDGEYRLGLMGGLQVEVPLGKKQKFSFQPDIHYIQKGASFVSTTPLITKIYTAIRYAELTPNFVYNLRSKKGGDFYLGGGPYLSFNLPSKKVSETPSNKTETELIMSDAPAADMRGLDWGGDVIMGYRLSNGLFVSANYIQGIRNLTSTGSPNDKVKNICFAFRVGYLFMNKPKSK